jgi:hypothetical protein
LPKLYGQWGNKDESNKVLSAKLAICGPNLHFHLHNVVIMSVNWLTKSFKMAAKHAYNINSKILLIKFIFIVTSDLTE